MTPESGAPPGSEAAQRVREVRERLERRRAEGTLPEIPTGELESQFDAVVEGVEAALLAQPPLDLEGVRRSVGEIPARPAGGRRALAVHYVDRLLRSLVRRLPGGDVNANEFARTAAPVVDALADRQRRLQELVLQVQLDRIRNLEYRISVLEEELNRAAARDSGDTPDA